MAEYARLPKLGLTMKTGIITALNCAVGDMVKTGDVIGEFETDKITGDIECPIDGQVVEILAEIGEEIEVLEPVFLIKAEGEEAISASETAKAESSTPETEATEDIKPVKIEKATMDGEWVRATPYARAVAKQNNVDLHLASAHAADGIIREKDILPLIGQHIKASPLAEKIAAANDVAVESLSGTGTRGRVMKQDVLNAMGASKAERTETRTQMSAMRKTIAKRLTQSKQEIPHVYFELEMDASALLTLKDSLKPLGEQDAAYKVTVNDLIIKAVAVTVKAYPVLAGKIDGDDIVIPNIANVGFAVSIDEGLVVPVITQAARLSVSEIAVVTKDLIDKAKHGMLTPSEMSGGDITITNLGATGVDAFSAIINPPESAIIAFGSIKKRPVVDGDELVIKPTMKITLSVDHRLIDGYVAAVFLAKLKANIENIYLSIV